MAIGLIAAVAIARAGAGPLNPPGTPTSTMVTLDELNNSINGGAIETPSEFAGPMGITNLDGFPGPDTLEGIPDSIIIYSWDFNVFVPVDAGTGQTTGSRTYEPIIIRKRIDKASPFLMQQLTNSSTLTEIVFHFYQDANPAPAPDYVITLNNAAIRGIRQSTVGVPNNDDNFVYEEVTITFQSIEWEHVPSGITHTDTWAAPP
jgi:type VI secretion system secreted protein Hcp